MSTLRRFAAAASATVLVAGAELAEAEVRTFDAPSLDGFAVSFCNRTADACGRPIAERWCAQQGYEYASGWTIAEGVDISSATVRLDDGGICRGASCDSFATISCGREGTSFRMPALGGLARTTVLTPNLRGSETAIDAVEYRVLIPGCHQRRPGEFLCETLHEYQHCRTLLQAGRVFGCRAGLAFDGGFAKPLAVAPAELAMDVRSSAAVTVERGRRGQGRHKGDAEFSIDFAGRGIDHRDWCLQRDRYIYHPTGPQGGSSDIGDTAECEAPVTGRVAPHADDLLAAYDLCEAEGAWGGRTEGSIEVLAAALYHVGSARPDFMAANGKGRAVVAPYVTVRAPLRITCKD